ncbi:MAG: folate-binding protein [Pseudomonadota bacterium]|nr:folate-binding protein [Pseudomonadota bacterium]
MAIKVIHLPERSLIAITGADAGTFLQGLITADINRLQVAAAAYAALLTPQGKMLFDFFVIREAENRYLIDCALAQRDALLKRLQFYKLRAKIDVQVDEQRKIHAVFDGHAPGAVTDPRPTGLGERLYARQAPADSGAHEYHERRVALGFAEGGMDFESGELFPHEANLDQMGGLSFEKGCFIGQEVVARMQHRGTARSRILPCQAGSRLPAKGSEILTGDRAVGRVLSGAGKEVLALLRLDRLAEGAAQGLMADGISLVARKPAWARFEGPAAGSRPT